MTLTPQSDITPRPPLRSDVCLGFHDLDTTLGLVNTRESRFGKSIQAPPVRYENRPAYTRSHNYACNRPWISQRFPSV